MIEKLEPIKAFNCSDTPQAKMQHHSYHNDCINKINELVDYINHSNHEYESIDDVVEDFVNVNETAHKFRSTNEQLRNQLDRTRKALDVAVDMLKEIDKTRCGVDVNLYAVNHKLLNAGNVFCWTTPDEIHNALEQITALEQKG